MDYLEETIDAWLGYKSVTAKEIADAVRKYYVGGLKEKIIKSIKDWYDAHDPMEQLSPEEIADLVISIINGD